MNTIDILEKLIAFPTLSRTPNLSLIDYLCDLFQTHGIETTRVPGESIDRVNLYARTGPSGVSGIMLSGHSDVVPVEGQDWSFDPFTMVDKDSRFYGRGTADMKGFIACATCAMIKASKTNLARPLEFAISFDEEIGCVGVQHLLPVIASLNTKPAFCIVGEPTELNVATGHKGKTAMRARCLGHEVHSALSPYGFNAIHLATDLIMALRHQQQLLIDTGSRDDDYEVAYTTIHAGIIRGGIALNIVPNETTIDFEIRNIKEDDIEKILGNIQQDIDTLIYEARKIYSGADIELVRLTSYPGLDTHPESEIVTLAQSLLGTNRIIKVSFGTEAGLFSEKLNIPTVVCGPGSMEQGHKPDEFITHSQLERCDAMLNQVIKTLKKAW